MIDKVSQRIFFGILLLAVTAAFLWLIRGFLQPIFWAIALGIVFYPVHARIQGLLSARQSLAAGLSLIMIVLIVILPLAGIAVAVTGEAASLYDRVRSGDINVSGAIDWIEQQVPQLVSTLDSFGIDSSNIREQLSSWAVTASQFIASQALQIGQNTLRVTVYFFLMLYLLFFFMRDGRAILDALVRALPIGDERERHLLERFAEVSRATIKGTLVVGIVQGAIGGVAFAALGIGGPVLWGVIMALLSIIPAVGPGLVWLPAAIVLISGGRIVAGIVLIVIGLVVIGLADNLLRPLLVGRDTRMPDYLILLSTIGGLAGFGLAGIVIGPVIAAFFLSVWEMAVDEYGDAAAVRDDDEAG